MTAQVVINLAGIDQAQAEDRRQRQCHHKKEDAAIGEVVSDQTHANSRRNIAGGVKCLIAPLPPVERFRPDDAERNSADGGDEHAGSSADERLRRDDRPERREERNEQRTRRQRDNGSGDQRPLGPNAVDQSAGWRLRDDAGDPANRQRKPDALFIPLIGSQINSQKRPDARLHVSEKKVEPVEAE
jgi:hypothetical protein